MRDLSKTRGMSIVAGILFSVYLFLAAIAIPAGTDLPGHYHIGNAIMQAMFFSYAVFTAQLLPLIAMAMYSGYAYIALTRRRRIGLISFAAHYGFAGAVATPFYLYRSPDLFETTRLQMAALGERPATVLFSFGPFILANTWYLARLLTAPSSATRHRIL